MDITATVKQQDLILAEGSVIEVLRRTHRIDLHPRLENALLIYDPAGRKALSHIYHEYIQVAQGAGVPIMVCAPTWRANKERLAAADKSRQVNTDAVAFMKGIKNEHPWHDHILIGGLTGCRHDAYKPYLGLSREQAYDFHAWQIEELAQSGVDFLIAETLPAVAEAAGIARAMSQTGIPYFIGFVINSRGMILDDNTLEHAVNQIDMMCDPPPVGFVISCSYPSFLHPDQQPGSVLARLVGYLANASSRCQTDLDGTESLEVDDIRDWGNRMIELNTRYGVKILGGCCGTGAQHLQYIVDSIKKEGSNNPI